MVEVSVIVPVWNRQDLTHSFLFHNWRLYENVPIVEFVIINNGSSDSTETTLNKWQQTMKDRLVHVHNEENLGFSGGNNIGVEHSNGKILIFLSNDVIPVGDYIKPIIEAMEPDVLIGTQLFDYDTGWNTFNNKIIPYLAGWCIAVEKETWERQDLSWDEQYFPCDYEDVDLSLDATKKGIELMPLKLPLRHLFGQSAKNIEGGREAITIENRERFIEKWRL